MYPLFMFSESCDPSKWTVASKQCTFFGHYQRRIERLLSNISAARDPAFHGVRLRSDDVCRAQAIREALTPGLIKRSLIRWPTYANCLLMTGTLSRNQAFIALIVNLDCRIPRHRLELRLSANCYLYCIVNSSVLALTCSTSVYCGIASKACLEAARLYSKLETKGYTVTAACVFALGVVVDRGAGTDLSPEGLV